MEAGYFLIDSGNIATLKALIAQRLKPGDVPFASDIRQNVPFYDVPALDLDDPALLAEWARVLRHGAGVICLGRAFPDTSPVDRATDVFRQIIAEERAAGAGKGDHFAAAGANDRIWNALQKHCLRDPEGFAAYYANPAIAAASRAWLGPHYQMTAQVNQVRPGGKAQRAHRDYHLGFQTAEVAASYPVHVHDLTAALTLQGAVAHCDMPIESGPTKLLPFSQRYAPGYIAFHQTGHGAFFEAHYIQLPLRKGDAIFFNPALFHAAGENRSDDIDRMANLLQVSSPFGRAMEAIDRDAMCRAVYPALRALPRDAAQAAIAATAEGYAFPTNLDTDPPLDGNAPETQADILRRAHAGGWPAQDLYTALDALAGRRTA
ncbi:phytanoyl-CoA dioxygenase [Salipiger sp. IMCC34102]|uniref:phytanoyl-CoA dioxygenase family protein n=1 Tax=Salipiger sp. IMCC34102 TaxID=2510647 RepID=UPI00101CF73D|nr:phytanoyl-CoA dioxygenase family protein [Salipiger sp. IMCC34102]RYH02103.1 phytanoyl-CoA dioxygenase [Salipiger sp. IMCC34102]